ncbi:ribosome small subunit-dependent GTPase A [Anaerobium acetethylicum]|uniref:Small ribosomal subunit biogenesis GTPase RsgA n=1 Tax=Anaerobium acetethylicum TaxID=1619234 RepID=A0A1D3TV94_9FIRM|nr:ribosome small subunit-dependent GTPase A [Anaerobium acetethylicum]SCP98057.1 ribosome biogenesis GTPase [Anaerobium acetethylicum]
MQGKIIKGIAGFYYVHVAGAGVYECKAKGIFRKQKIKPLVGDNVAIDILDEAEKKGNINDILPRKNELIRPAVANVDQALVIFAITRPSPNFNLLDRFLITMERQGVETIICFNKKDIAQDSEIEQLQDIYRKCGYRIVFTSTVDGVGLDKLKELMEDRTTVVAGPSGVGKSSIINILQPKAGMETGGLSEKIERGKHTTRHSEIINIEGNTYIMDTPGFSSLALLDFTKEELRDYFIEFEEYEPACRFQGCSHINEPDCGVKAALEAGDISRTRYSNYVEMYNELKDQRRY